MSETLEMTVEARILVGVDQDGQWYAIGDSDIGVNDTFAYFADVWQPAHVRFSWVYATVPMPVSYVAADRVEPAEPIT